MSSWYNTKNDNGIVVSTRVRLARNISDFPFSKRMTDTQRKELKEKVKDAIKNSNTPFSENLQFIDMNSVPKNEIISLVERHVISPEFANSKSEKALVISNDESISIMIGEEDHIRIQVILAGLQLEKAYDIAERIDTFLDSQLHFSFNNELGYLTECPTNLGTGLRASVMLHLPICESKGETRLLSETLSKIGFTIRGIYGEGSKSEGSLYQVSNQITLGISEKNAIDNLKIIVNQIIEKETNLRNQLNKLEIEDIVFRALGTLKNARVMTSKEMISLLSKIKIGIDMGIIKEDINPTSIMIKSAPYMLMKKFGEMTPQERDIARATQIREILD